MKSNCVFSAGCCALLLVKLNPETFINIRQYILLKWSKSYSVEILKTVYLKIFCVH